jgi:hypothetical protein
MKNLNMSIYHEPGSAQTIKECESVIISNSLIDSIQQSMINNN